MTSGLLLAALLAQAPSVPPIATDTTSRQEKLPELVQAWVTNWLVSKGEPSPKSQIQVVLLVPALGVDRSVNWARRGKQPALSLTLKLSVGFPQMVMYWLRVRVLDPWALVTVNLTE